MGNFEQKEYENRAQLAKLRRSRILSTQNLQYFLILYDFQKSVTPAGGRPAGGRPAVRECPPTYNKRQPKGCNKRQPKGCNK